MRTILKGCLAVLLSFLIVFAVIPQNTAQAASNSDYQYEDHDSYVVITKYIGSGGTVVIPAQIDDKNVTGIKRNTFSNCNNVTSVTIPGSVESLEDNVFYDCGSLEAINVDTANTHFISENGILYNHDKTTLIGYPCAKAGAYVMPASVTSIAYLAFEGCYGITSVTLSDGITDVIGSGLTFYSCSSLASVNVNSTNRNFESDHGILYNIGKSTIVCYPPGKTGTSFVIPSSVTAIGREAFHGCYRLTSITVPSGVTAIGISAFSCTSVTDITLPAGITEIATYAFYGCSHLTGIVLPDSVKTIGDTCFGYCDKLSSITIPDGVTTIESGAFSGCTSLEDIAIPSSVSELKYGVFSDCTALARAVFAGGMPTFGFNVFQHTADGFKVYYHVTRSADWAGYTGYPKQAYCVATVDPQNGAAAYPLIAAVSDGHIEAPDAPGWAGHTLDGWYQEAACSNAWHFDASDNVTDNISLFAKWTTNNYKVTFNSQEGSTVDEQTAPYDTLLTEPAEPTRTGYVFCDWYKEAACNHKWLFATDKVTDNITLYARWVPVEQYVAAPDSVTVSPKTYNSISITWGAVAGATKYELWRATANGGPYKLITTTSGLSYTNRNVTTGTPYYYKVRAYRQVNRKTKAYGDYSDVKSAATALGTPAMKTPGAVSYNSIKISWYKVAGATKYQVWRATKSDAADVDFTLVGTTSGLSFTNKKVDTGTPYYYKVCAVRAGKAYGFSDIKSAVTTLGKPTHVSAKRASATSIKVSWSAVPGATKYEVWGSAASDVGTFTLLGETGKTSFTNTGLTAGGIYYYRVIAYRVVGSNKVYGAYSIVVHNTK